MRSIFTKILLWSFGTLVVSLIAFVGISRFLSERAFRRGEPLRHPLAVQAEQARQAFESGGRKQLELYLEQLYTFFPDDHHLTDADGKDVLTGESRSSLLAQARGRPGIPGLGRGRMVMATPTADGRYRFIAVVQRRPLDLWSFIPYYVLVLLAVALLCYMLATNLATPLRVLGQTVERFGKGNLAARVNSRRKD
jgi:HAMP domain-containing protein